MLKKMKLLALPVLVGCTHAFAATVPLAAQQVLTQFNLVTLGNATTSSHVDGRSYIGGNLYGNNAVFAMHPNDMPASSYAGLTVGGNAQNFQVTAGGATVGGNVTNGTVNNGPAVVGGNVSNSNFNGNTGGSYIYGTTSGYVNKNSGTLTKTAADDKLEIAHSTDMAAVLNQTSAQLKGLSSTGSTASVNGNKVTFNAVADANGLAVFDLSAVDDILFGKGEFEFNYGTAKTVIFNTDVTSATFAANFLGGGAQKIGAKTIWNFYNATNLTFSNQFGGSILATNATLNIGQNIEGSVFAKTLSAQTGEIHLQTFSGTVPAPVNPVPLPASWLMMLPGLVGVRFFGRRRQQG